MKLFISLFLIGLSALCQAQQLWTSGRPDGHAPVSVMGDHTHNKGEWMFSYRFMSMDMAGMRSGTESQTSDAVLSDFRVTPTSMPMRMHMLGVMYAVSDRLTLMGMASYVSQSMDHVTRMGGMFTTESQGIGDTWISGLYKFFDKNRQRIHANLGLRIPTGSIDETDITPASTPNEALLPYPMQLGTGTFDLKPGVTYLLQGDNTSFGAQTSVSVPLNRNDRGYRWGTRTELLAWGAYKLNKLISVSVKGDAIFQGRIQGADNTFAMAVDNAMVPTVFNDNFGGEWLFLGAGVNLYIPNGFLKNVRVGFEYDYPVYQNLNGPQMEMQDRLTVGVQYSL